MDVSVVVPLFNEEGNVHELVRRLRSILDSLEGRPDYELVLVNDGSRDGTLEALRAIARTTPHLVIVNLSRNFGHQSPRRPASTSPAATRSC